MEYVLFPLFFNIYLQNFFKEALKNTKKAIRVNGLMINNLKYRERNRNLKNYKNTCYNILDTL